MSRFGTILGTVAAVCVAAASFFVAQEHAPAVTALLLWME